MADGSLEVEPFSPYGAMPLMCLPYLRDNACHAWVPEDLDFEIQIQVDDNHQYTSDYFHSVVLMDSIENPYARDPGLIYLKTEVFVFLYGSPK